MTKRFLSASTEILTSCSSNTPQNDRVRCLYSVTPREGYARPWESQHSTLAISFEQEILTSCSSNTPQNDRAGMSTMHIVPNEILTSAACGLLRMTGCDDSTLSLRGRAMPDRGSLNTRHWPYHLNKRFSRRPRAASSE